MNQAEVVLLTFVAMERTIKHPVRVHDLQAFIADAFTTGNLPDNSRSLLRTYLSSSADLFRALDYLRRQGLLYEDGTSFGATHKGKERAASIQKRAAKTAEALNEAAARAKWGDFLDNAGVPRYMFHAELIAQIKELTPDAKLLHRALDRGSLSALAHLKAYQHDHQREFLDEPGIGSLLAIYARALERASIGMALTLEERYNEQLRSQDTALRTLVRGGG